MLWLHRLFHRRDAEQRLEAELRFHLDQRINDFVASGLSPDEARRQANLVFGGLEQVKQDCREAHFETAIGDLARDFRYAFRSLIRDRRFALVAILVLALGIAASTVMFSIIYNVIFDTFPYLDFQRSVEFDMHDLTAASDAVPRFHYSIPEFLAMRDQNHAFEDMVGNYQLDVLYTDGKRTRRFLGGYVTTNGFQFLGVPPLLGRFFSAEDGKPDGPLVFMMNYQLWRAEFNGDPTIVGRSFLLNGKSRKLVGIMPQRFNGYGSSLWFPLDLRPGADGNSFPMRDPPVLWVLARLRKGVNLQTAGTDVDGILHRLAQAGSSSSDLYPQRFKVVARSLVDFVVGDFKSTLYSLLAAVCLLLLIACANVGNLLVTRATMREREIAVRASLGASRARLIRQLLVESVLLAAAACVAGCFLAYLALKALVPIIPRGPIPEETVIGLNPAALLFAMAIAALATLVCGLSPALHAVRRNLVRGTTCAKGSGGGFRYRNLRAALVIAEVALSMVLLSGAALMIRSFFALTHVEFSFDPTHTLYARVISSADGHFQSVSRRKLFFDHVLERVTALPGVTNATESIGFPPLGGPDSDITVLGKVGPHQPRNSLLELCNESYFRTLGLRVVLGRLLTQSDIESTRHVAVINQAFARVYFGTENPLQQKIKFNVFDELPETPHGAYFEIIGVIADVKNNGLLEPTTPEAFLPDSVTGAGGGIILATTSVDPKLLVAHIEREVWAVDPNAAITMSGSLKELLAERAYVQPQFGTIVSGVFAGIGLILVLVGIFSVMAYSVTLQTHTIGVRMALGAQQRDVLTMVLWQGLRLVSLGIIVGLFASLVLARFLSSLIHGVSATDPLTFFIVVTIFLATSLIACLLPARRATRLDPLLALRYE